MAHVQHYAKLHQQGKLLKEVLFLDIDSGGMMIPAEEVTREELEQFAAANAAVIDGLLVYEIKTEYVPMSQQTLE